jgi:DNA-binding SARP family transcriptional activator
MQAPARLLSPVSPDEAEWPVMICVLGTFRLLKSGKTVATASSSKTEALLCSLALLRGDVVRRDTLLDTLWPEGDPALAGQSLNSLLYYLRKLVGDGIGGAAPVLHREGCYQLNADAGVGVDVDRFEAAADEGERWSALGNGAAAAECFTRAIRLYRGDLCGGTDTRTVMERERLRARHLSILARLAEHSYGLRKYATCLQYALRLLSLDPCREDAHRLAMRCYVRQGERAQALRQYRLCEDVLRTEFEAVPEPATEALYEQVRLDPAGI